MKRLFLLIIASLLLMAQGAWSQAEYITDLIVVGADDDDDADWYYEEYEKYGWIGIPKDLNDGAGGHYVYLMYKTNRSPGSSGTAINNVYLYSLTFEPKSTVIEYNDQTYYMVGFDGDQSFKNHRGDLNCNAGGQYWIHLYYTKDQGDYVHLTNIKFNNDKAGAVFKNESSKACDLNEGAGGEYLYMHIERNLATKNPEVYTGMQLREVAPFGNVNVRMMNDIKTNKTISFGSGANTLDLNGFTLDRGLTEPADAGCAISVSSWSYLTIMDSSAGHTGVITGGASKNHGGAISNSGALTITGGTITGNTTVGLGGAIFTQSESYFGRAGSLNIQGNVVITGNTAAGFPSDVYVDAGQVINLTGPLAEGSRIGISSDLPDMTVTSGYATHHGGTDPNTFFFSNSDFRISANGSGEVITSSPGGSWVDYRAAEFSNQTSSAVFIDSEEELALLAYKVNQGNPFEGIVVTLNKDLNLSAHQWLPIGISKDLCFKGKFDGNGHTITGLYVYAGDYAGLFGYVSGSDASRYIKNLFVKKSNIRGSSNVGTIAGYITGSVTIQNIWCEANVTGVDHVGGIIGQAQSEGGTNIFSTYRCPDINHCLYRAGRVLSVGNHSTIAGTVKYRNDAVDMPRCYYVEAGSKTGHKYEWRAIPVHLDDSKGVYVEFDTSKDGIVFNDTAYFPLGTHSFTIKNELNHRITSVKVNGSVVGTAAGTYQSFVSPYYGGYYLISATTEAANDIAGNGTASDPYLINSVDDWNLIANSLREGRLQDSDLHYKLTTDISVDDRLGTNDYPFRGVFDGDGHTLTVAFGSSSQYLDMICSPFYKIQDATIQNLIVDGNIYSSSKYNGGLVGKVAGTRNLIRNCVSRVTINSNIEHECCNGGFIGQLNIRGAHVAFEGCLFTGQLLGSWAYNWGGFVGWRASQDGDRNTVIFKDCLFAPTRVSEYTASMFCESCTFCYTKDNDTNGATYTNSYFMTQLRFGDGGKRAYSISADMDVTMENTGTGTEYNVSGITAYDVGITYNNVLYAGSGDLVRFNLSGSSITNRYYDDGYRSLAGVGNPYTLTMPGRNTVIMTRNNLHPTELASTGDWNDFSAAIADGADYTGETVTMTADITASVVPDHDAPFRGVFDGCGHTLTLAYGTSGSYLSRTCAPFSHIENATIRNLVIDGSIYCSGMYSSSLLVKASGTENLIRNCISRVSINNNRGDDCSNGGFIGLLNINGTNVAIEGCAFVGEIVGNKTKNWGGFIGWRAYEDNNQNTVTFTDCLFAPTKANIEVWNNNISNSRTFCRSTGNTTDGATYNNCYYGTVLEAVDGGNKFYSIFAGEDLTIENVGASTEYNVSRITGYGTGIKYNDVLYAASGEQVGLTLTYSGTIPPEELTYYVSPGTLSGTSNPYTLTMTNDNAFISALSSVHPTEIASAADWDKFCSTVSAGYDYDGVTVTMTADVVTSKMAGNEYRPFRGVLDGNGHTLTLAYGSSDQYSNEECAPFYRIENVTIRNLVVDGSIYSLAMHNASLAVKAVGARNYIQNCISRVSINSNRNGDCTNGGFIGLLNTNGTRVDFEGCAFVGKMLGSQTKNWGGFVGWRAYEDNNHNTVSLTDCFFAPKDIYIAMPDDSNSRTFCRSTNAAAADVFMTSCYYETMLQVADGGKKVNGFVTLPVNIGTAGTTYNVSNITAYTYGLKYDGRYYVDHIDFVSDASNTEIISEMATAYNERPINVTLQNRTFYKDEYWYTLCLPFDLTLAGSILAAAEARTLNGSTFDHSTGLLTLNFSDPVETLTAGTPYIIKWKEDAADLTISTTAEWDAFAASVSNGTDYSGKVVALAEDITVSTMAGTSDRPFKGTFNGRGHTLNLNLDFNEDYCSPFRCVKDANFVNLRTAGTIKNSKSLGRVGGFASEVSGTLNFTNCRSSVTFSCSSYSFTGGFIGCFINVATVTFTDCLFDGNLADASSSMPGGFAIGALLTSTYKNCVSMNTSSCYPFALPDSKTTYSNCYCSYNSNGSTNNLIGSMTNEQLVTTLGNGWQLKDGKVLPVMRSGDDIANPAFYDVAVTAAEPIGITPGFTAGTDGDGSVTFMGTYDPVEIGPKGDNRLLYFSTGNTLYWPNGAMTIDPFRAYFRLNSATAATRGIVLNIGGGMTKVDLTSDPSPKGEESEYWYTLDGRKQDGKPTKKGLYINNGKKTIIK